MQESGLTLKGLNKLLNFAIKLYVVPVMWLHAGYQDVSGCCGALCPVLGSPSHPERPLRLRSSLQVQQ